MGFLDRRRKQKAVAEAIVESLQLMTTLPVLKDETSFPADDGSTIHSIGYALIDPDRQLTPAGDDGWLREHGCRLVKVAGITHHPEAAQDERFKPGAVTVLAREPDNPADPNAVSIWDATGELKVGYVPADVAPEIAERIAAEELIGGVITREYRRDSPTGPRLGLVMLITPVGRITLRIEALGVSSVGPAARTPAPAPAAESE